MGLSVGHPTSLEELYRQMSSSPAFARMMQTQDQRDGGSSDPRSWLQARMRTHGLSIPPMPQQAVPPQEMPSQAFSALGAPQGQAPQMPAQAPPIPQLPSMPQAQNRQSGGFLSGLIPEGGEFKKRLGDMLMGFGGGSNINESLAMGGRSMMEGRRARAPLRAQAEQLNRTRQYAMQLGIPQDVAMGLDATNLMALIKERYTAQNEKEKPVVVNGRIVMPSTGDVTYESPPEALSEDAKADNALDREKFEFEKSKTDPDWEKLSDGSLFNKRTGEVKQIPGARPGVDFKEINTLRKEVQDTPQIKNYMQAAPIYRSMVETAPRNSKASDLNLVYGLGKIMDPTSVVRDGERVAVQNTASLPDWLQGAIASLNGGSALTPETRARILEEAQSRMNAYHAETEEIRKQYEGITGRYGIDMADIWQDLPKLQDYKPAAPAPSGSPPPTNGGSEEWGLDENGNPVRVK